MKLTPISESTIPFKEAATTYERLLYQIKKVIVGQDELIEKVMLSILIGGHCLLESPPGLAKTLLLKTISSTIGGAEFKRVQFTPDLLPADLTGMQIYHPEDHSFNFNPGPIFANLVLVDEINRAPAKVQSALLEAMQEKQVTVMGETHRLPDVFVVMATQNPFDHEGTYELPEAQIDRFIFKLSVDYPDQHEEESIVNRFCSALEPPLPEKACSLDDISSMRVLLEQVFIEAEIIHKIVQIVQATRNPEKCSIKELSGKLDYGASPRASIAIAQACKGLALLRGRNYVKLDDLNYLLKDILRHRIKPSYRSAMEGLTPERVVEIIAEKILSKA